jgi:hypothetical protein
MLGFASIAELPLAAASGAGGGGGGGGAVSPGLPDVVSAEAAVGRIHGRRFRLLRYIDYEAGWVVIADGPAGTPRMDESYAAYRWQIRDTRETERKVKAFVKSNAWLVPMGVEDGFGSYTDEDGNAAWLVPPTDPLAGEYHDTALGGSVRFDDYWSGPPPGLETVEEDVVVTPKVEEALIATAQELGDPFPVLWTWPNIEVLWRIEGSGDDWTVVVPTDLYDGSYRYAKPRGAGKWWSSLTGPAYDVQLADGTEVRAVYGMMIRGAGATGTFPTDGDRVEVAARWKGEPTDFAPLHIEGLTPGQLLKKLYDGEYSYPDPVTGETVPTAIRYLERDVLLTGGPDSYLTQDDTTEKLVRLANVTETPLVRLRITEPVDDLREWTEKFIYSVVGWFPAIDNDGRVSPKSQIPPQLFTGLENITNAITEPQPDWDGGETICNVLTVNYPRWYRVDIEDADSVDRLERRDVTQEWRDEASITRHGIESVTYQADAFAAVGDSSGEPVLSIADETGTTLTNLRRLYVFNRYRNGAASLQVPVRRDYCYALRAGDWVVVDLSWFPDYVTARRGLLTGAQILAIYDVDCEWRILLLEEAHPVVEVS